MGESDDERRDSGEPGDDFPIDFTTFVLSLSSNAAVHLDLAPHPEHDEPGLNLPMAKQTIDILGLLQEKTRGNLTGEEERLLGEVLYKMRMEYVSASQRGRSDADQGG